MASISTADIALNRIIASAENRLIFDSRTRSSCLPFAAQVVPSDTDPCLLYLQANWGSESLLWVDEQLARCRSHPDIPADMLPEHSWVQPIPWCQHIPQSHHF